MSLRLCVLGVLAAALDCVAARYGGNAIAEAANSIAVPLDAYFNNRAFGSYPGEADFDGSQESYPVSALDVDGTFLSSATGIEYLLRPGQGWNSSDNVVCDGQTVAVPVANYFSTQLLIASDLRDTIVSGNFTFTYADNSTATSEVRAEPWWAFLTLYKGQIIMPSRYTANGTNTNTTHIYEWTVPLNPAQKLSSITFPETTNVTTGRMHVFAVSLGQTTGVQVQNLRATQKQAESQAQIVEVTINNAGPDWVHGDGLSISIDAPGVKTVKAGSIKRLRPGDQKKVNVEVVGSANHSTATVTLSAGNSTTGFQFPATDFGFKDYTEALDSLTLHESPEWFNNAKFGIMVHWGVYAVPGWGNSTPNEVYAEWHWWYSHHRAGDTADTWDYDLRTFGPETVYDDFFQNFTAANYDPKAWVDLFDDAGAQYFVITTKHHDGFALFDTKETSNRSALHYGPKRDLLKDLFDAAKMHHPHLHRGTYFSLPEWYNPDFGPYGFAQDTGNASTSWPGILATNPYTGATEPYTGYIPVDDFIADLMVPQQQILAYDYETDIMWCDCGAANGTAAFAAAWFNDAAAAGRQVAMNSRCGIPQGADFDTPEYTTFSAVSPRKWESNQGMDPYSYGYNRATAETSYMNTSTIVSSLVDMVSKNGNFLLDVGPKADGSILDVEAAHLRAAGKWVKKHEEAIFNTTYWFVTPEAGEVRFTQTDDAFYLLFLEAPGAGEEVYVDAPLPVMEGDAVEVLGEGIAVEWGSEGDGVRFVWPEEMEGRGEYCWVLKVRYAA